MNYYGFQFVYSGKEGYILVLSPSTKPMVPPKSPNQYSVLYRDYTFLNDGYFDIQLMQDNSPINFSIPHEWEKVELMAGDKLVCVGTLKSTRLYFGQLPLDEIRFEESEQSKYGKKYGENIFFHRCAHRRV